MHAFLTKPDLQFLPIPIPDFGAAIRRRRFALGLNCSRAAASVGIKKHEWQLLEHGYIPTPENENFLRALAGTLEIRVDFATPDHLCSDRLIHFENRADAGKKP